MCQITEPTQVFTDPVYSSQHHEDPSKVMSVAETCNVTLCNNNTCLKRCLLALGQQLKELSGYHSKRYGGGSSWTHCRQFYEKALSGCKTGWTSLTSAWRIKGTAGRILMHFVVRLFFEFETMTVLFCVGSVSKKHPIPQKHAPVKHVKCNVYNQWLLLTWSEFENMTKKKKNRTKHWFDELNNRHFDTRIGYNLRKFY